MKPFLMPPILLRGIIFLIAGSLLFASACKAPPERKLEKDGFTLKYEPQSVLGADGKDFRLDHPLQISQDAMAQQLRTLVYVEMHLMGKTKYVFSEDDVERMSRLLAKALTRATSAKVVSFVIETKRGTTEALLFSTDDRLHWRFSRINNLKFSNAPTNRPQFGRGATNWKLVPNTGQRYFAKTLFMGKSDRENWIVANLDAKPDRRRSKKKTESSMKKAPSQKSSKPATQSAPELEEKLEMLKQLREKKLIDEDEYKRKRQELMDKYL